jgi:addiction module HigA family antidote
MAKKLPAVHPGEVLRDEFLDPMELTPYAVAKAIGVPRTRIERLAREETPVTADTALRLSRYFGTTAAFWMGLQAQYDLEIAADQINKELKRIAPRRASRLRRRSGDRRSDIPRALGRVVIAQHHPA